MRTSWPHQLPVVPPPVNYSRLHRSTSPLCILYFSVLCFVFLYLYRSKYIKFQQDIKVFILYFVNVYLYYMYFKCMCKFQRIALNWCVSTAIENGELVCLLPLLQALVYLCIVYNLSKFLLAVAFFTFLYCALYLYYLSKFERIGELVCFSPLCIELVYTMVSLHYSPNWCLCHHSCIILLFYIVH